MFIKSLGEFELIHRLKDLLPPSGPDVVVGIDDDAAAFTPGNDLSLLSVDAFVEGVHFDLRLISFRQLGWRLLAANLSDIAAMGGIPRLAVVAMALRGDLQVREVEALYRGMADLAERFDVAVVGGDTTKSPDRLFFSLAIFGDVARERLALRSGACAGDAVLVTGDLGRSRAGLRVLKSGKAQWLKRFDAAVSKYRTPVPRVEEARFLVERFPVHSMIDISDGLASEVHHLCQASTVGACITAEDIPIGLQTRQVAKLNQEEALQYALSGGEDFELLFTLPYDRSLEVAGALTDEFDLPCTVVGRIVAPDKGVKLRQGDKEVPLQATGFDHFKA